MQETVIVQHVADYLAGHGWRVWYNPKGLGKLLLPIHYISVAGRYPDILALNATDEIMAVEAKGDTGKMIEGLGQALIYKKGVHRSYLAGPADRLLPVREAALSHGVGVLPVSPDGVASPEAPVIDTVPRYLSDVYRELSILAARGNQTRRISSSALRLNHPLHYLAPVLFIEAHRAASEVAAALASPAGWGLGHAVTRDSMIGARILGLVTVEGESLHLTEKGHLVRNMMEPLMHRMTISMLRRLTARSSGLLIQSSPLLGGIMRFLFLEDPDVRQLRDLLVGAGRLNLGELLEKLLHESPNLVLSLFCRQSEKERVSQFLRLGRESEALRPHEINAWLMKRSFFQLKRQLVHLGILVDHPALGGGNRAEQLESDWWELRF